VAAPETRAGPSDGVDLTDLGVFFIGEGHVAVEVSDFQLQSGFSNTSPAKYFAAGPLVRPAGLLAQLFSSKRDKLLLWFAG